MKKLLKLSGVLSWINLVAGALLVIGGLITMLTAPSAAAVLLTVVLPGAVILHSYAALQLKKNILKAIPLSTQTPTGIRVMGYTALFFGIMSLGNAVVLFQQVPEVAKLAKLPPQLKNVDINAIIRASGVFTLLISISIIVNVVLNFRILKWYYFFRDQQEK